MSEDVGVMAPSRVACMMGRARRGFFAVTFLAATPLIVWACWLVLSWWGLVLGLIVGPLISHRLFRAAWPSPRNNALAVSAAGVIWGLLGILGFANLADYWRERPGTLQFGAVPYVRKEGNFTLIEDGLYQGGDVGVPPAGTVAVLNLHEVEDPYRAEHHQWSPIPDAEPAPSLDWLRRQVAFVDAQRSAGRTTYVHCQAGISRAGMVVCGYLMQKNNWTRDQALIYIRSKRPQTRPNEPFMELLLEWERSVRK